MLDSLQPMTEGACAAQNTHSEMPEAQLNPFTNSGDHFALSRSSYFQDSAFVVGDNAHHAAENRTARLRDVAFESDQIRGGIPRAFRPGLRLHTRLFSGNFGKLSIDLLLDSGNRFGVHCSP